MTVKAIVTDIEGTTSAISFVHDVLFPYAARELPVYLQSHAGDAEVATQLDAVRSETNEPGAGLDRVVEILLGWIAEDRKATPLKTLQGYVWRHGYEQRDFTGHVYDDAVAGLRRWHGDGIPLYVYSSGSTGAQKLLFGFSDAGDLRPLFSGYFDTRVGHKQESASYAEIARRIGELADAVLFLSDVAGELDAAREAGMQTCQLVRDEEVVVGDHGTAASFDDVIINR